MTNAFLPCLPTKVIKAPSGEHWVHEIKHDGFRIIARRVGRDVRLFTKQGADFSRRYPLVVEAINRLRVSSVVFDGEAVCDARMAFRTSMRSGTGPTIPACCSSRSICLSATAKTFEPSHY